MWRNRLNKYAIPLSLALVTAAAPALAEDPAAPAADAAAAPAEEQPGDWLPGAFSGSVALTSNYMFRGISQTNNEPAIQGALTYTLGTKDFDVDMGGYDISAYGGVWGSNVDFQDGDEAQVELDWSFGLTGALADTGVGWTLGGTYYNYPGARGNLNYDYWEILPSISYAPVDWVSLAVGMPYSPDYFGASGDSYYPNGTASVIIPGIPEKWFKLKANGGVGYQFIDKNAKYGTPSYLTWTLGLTATVKGVDIGVAYYDTNLSKSDCFGGTQNWCDTRFVGTLSYAF